jgi:putative ABC transport system permease protein
MSSFSGLRRYLRLPGRRRDERIEQEIADELAFHLEMRADELARSGLTDTGAYREARRQFGDLDDARAYCREVDADADQRSRRSLWLDELAQDLRLAWRQLRRNPAFAAASGLTLAAGIGVTTAVYSVVHAYLIRPLPYPEPDRLAWVIAGPSRTPFPNAPSLRDVDWTFADTVFASTVAWDLDGFTLAGGDRPEYIDGAWISRGYLSSLGVRVAHGRAFHVDEFRAGAPPVALISDALWARRFDRDPAVIGRTIRAYSTDRPNENELVTIVGIVPADAWHVTRFTDFLRPLTTNRMPSIVRLAPGTTLARAQVQFDAAVRAQLGAVDPAWHMSLSLVQDEYTFEVRPTLLALLGAALFMLLIAGASVAGALVARAASRRGELAIRTALGASRPRIIRQLLTESLVLTMLAAAGGALLAWMLLDGLGPFIGEQLHTRVPGAANRLAPSMSVLALTIATSVAFGIVLGLLPAFASTRVSPGLALRGEARGAVAAAGASRLRRTLIASQIALTMVLLVGAGLMARTVAALANTPLGFNPDGVVKANLLFPLSHYPDSASRTAGAERMLDGLRAVPGVRAAAVASPGPFRPAPSAAIQAEGSVRNPDLQVAEIVVSPGYFDAMQIAVLGGRAFSAVDAPGAPRVAMISERLARRLWPGENAIGRRLRIGESEEWRTVVGVTRETRKMVTADQISDVYVPFGQDHRAYVSVVVRTTDDPRTVGPTLQRAVGRVHDVLALSSIEAMADVVTRDGSRHRTLATLLATFALFALGLAVLGLYASLSYVVAQRRRELALRVAVGADASSILRLVLGEGARTVAGGVVVGIALSFAFQRLLESQLYGVAATDPVTFVAITAVLSVVALAAIAVPARRAMRVDPASLLRAD